MHASFRLGVELPPVPVPQSGTAAGGPPTGALEPWWRAVRAATHAGADVVWFTGGAGGGGTSGGEFSCDPCTLAAAAVSIGATTLLGVVSGVPLDRHPAILARDVTALDVVSDGRAAVMLRWAGVGPGHGLGQSSLPYEHLGEAVAVCRAVLRDEDPIFEGRHLHVAGAINRPRPRRGGGPPLLVHAPVSASALARRDDAAAFFLRQAVVGAAGIVCSDDPADVAGWRALVDDAAAVMWFGEKADELPVVVSRTTLDLGSAGGGGGGPARVSERLHAARDAGAEGIVVRLPPARRADAGLQLGPDDADRMAGALAVCFAPWRP